MKTILKTFLLTIIFAGAANAQMFWNHAGSFNGNVNTYAAIPNSSSLNLTGSFTIECWLYEMLRESHYILYKGNDYSMNMSSLGKFTINTAGTVKLRSSSVIPLNKWTHVAVTHTSNGNYRIYINGSLDTTGTFTENATASTDSLLIGKRDNGSGFYGKLDEIRIWNRSLSFTEINDNMRTSLGATGGIYNGLVLSLTFQDENSNGTIFNLTDWSGSGNNAHNIGIIDMNLENRPATYLSINESLQLDGTNSYFAVPNHSSFGLNGEATIEAWVYMTGIPSGTTQTIISKGSGSTGYSLFVNSNGLLSYRINSGSGASFYHMPLNKWVHAAMTIDASNLVKIYVNGVENISITRLPIVTDTDSLFIGKSSLGNYFSGYIDEVRIAQFTKTAAQVNEFLYKSVDASNDLPGTDIVWNFDGLARDNGNFGTRGYFRGNARFSNPVTQNDIPQSPIIRADTLSFSNGYTIKTTDRRIPETGTLGNMKDDSLVISGMPVINDINLFIGLNHTSLDEIEMVLIAPNGDSVTVSDNFVTSENNNNLVTIFDDNADSSLINNRYTDISARIKPLNGMNIKFSGDNPNGVWRLRIRDVASGDTGRVYVWGIQVNNSPAIGIQNISSEIPQHFSLSQNYPNPFNPVTNINFQLPVSAFAKLVVYDITGRQTAVLVNEMLSAGTYKADFDGTNLASGVYFYRLETEKFTEVKKMVLVK